MLLFNVNLAARSILKNKLFSIVNIIGLSVSMAASLVLALFVYNEWSHDTFHNKFNRIVRLTELQDQGGQLYNVAVTPGPLGPALQREFPEIVNWVRFQNWSDQVKSGEKVYDENRIHFTDNSIFSVFDFPLIKGDPRKALLSPGDIIITENIADKYFGKNWRSDSQLLEKTFKVLNSGEFKLAGVAKNLPDNSSFAFDILLPFSHLASTDKSANSWGSNNFHTYLELKKGTSVETFSGKIEDRLKANDPKMKDLLQVQQLKDQYLNSAFDFQTDWGKRSSKNYIKIFSGAGILLLFIACVNFINLSTARSVSRAMEVGMRRLNGASRLQLIGQFLVESTFVALIAGILALILATASHDWLVGYTGNAIETYLTKVPVLLLYLAFVVVVGIIAGLYPAVILSAYNPAEVIRKSWKNTSGKTFRQFLVVGQFAISVILVICTFFIYRQLNFIRNKDLGFQKDQLITLRLGGELKMKSALLQRELSKLPSVIKSAPSTVSLINVDNSGYIEWQGMQKDDKFLITNANINPDFISTLGMKILSGTNFSKQLSNDTANYIINVSAAKRMGYTEQDAIGKQLLFWGAKGNIVAVVKDFHFKPLKAGIEPFIFRYQPQDRYFNMFVKLRNENTGKTIKQIEEIYRKLEPEAPFTYSYVKDAINETYKEEQRTASVVFVFAVLTIFVACLGLFGLTVYSAERRIKEIGIRKVLGARLSSIASLLTKDFLQLVLIAIVIAIPIAWLLIYQWLNQYAYRTNIDLWIFFFVAILVILAAAITVSFQTFAAAKLNPVKNLRSE